MGNYVSNRVRELEEDENLRLSRSVSTRYLDQLVRRPYGYPRQVGSLLSVNQLHFNRQFAAAGSGLGLSATTALYFSGFYGGLGRGRARSLPALHPSPLIRRVVSMESIMRAYRGRIMLRPLTRGLVLFVYFAFGPNCIIVDFFRMRRGEK